MMDDKAVFWGSLTIIGLLCFVGGHSLGEKDGRRNEQEETRQFVNERMTKAGFCKWFEMSRISEDSGLSVEKVCVTGGQIGVHCGHGASKRGVSMPTAAAMPRVQMMENDQ